VTFESEEFLPFRPLCEFFSPELGEGGGKSQTQQQSQPKNASADHVLSSLLSVEHIFLAVFLNHPVEVLEHEVTALERALISSSFR